MTIAYNIASPTWGGGEQYVFDLARSIKQQYGFRTIFIFPFNSEQRMIERFANIGLCISESYRHKLLRFCPSSAEKMAQIIDKNEIDILHLNNRQNYYLAVTAVGKCKRKVRLIATQHLVKTAQNNAIWRWIYRHIDTLICVSDCVRNAYLSAWKNSVCPFNDVRTIHNSVLIDRQNACCNQDVPEPAIFYHGRICEEKGIFPLIKALEDINDLPFKLVVAGSVGSSNQEKWDNILSHCTIREKIEFIGFQTDITHFIAQYQIGIVPTIVPEAGGPLALLENMAMGMPTITTNNGSQTEFIQNGINGLLYDPHDTKALTKHIRQLLTDKAYAQRLGEQAQKDFFKLHSYSDFITKMYHLYADAF